MKALFINASKYWDGRTYQEYPYGVGILATLANQAGFQIEILDMSVDKRNYMNVVLSYSPDVIAISFMSPSVQIARKVIEEIKARTDCLIVAGGIHSTLYPESVLAYGADIVILGEGEPTFVPVLEYLIGNRKFTKNNEPDYIPNLVYKDENGNIKRTRASMESVNLDDLPIMNRDLFNLNLYAHHTILTSRCCPYQCRFCCSWAPGGRPGRVMSKERILSELEWLVNHYGALTLYWGDEIFFWTKKDRLDFCDSLKERNLPIKFIIQLRADLIEEDLLEKLLSVGCVKVCIGAESGSDKLLRAANKRITASQIEKAIKTCVKVGLLCKTWWMVGLPGGTVEDQLLSLDIIERSMPNEVAVHQFVPLPGSDFWNHADSYGIHLPEEASFENLNYYSNPENLKYDYITGDELISVLKTYEERLIKIGYVPTDLATENDRHIFTTPFQKKTFNI